MLRYASVCFNMPRSQRLKRSEIVFNMLQHTSKCFNMLQNASPCFDMPQHGSTCFDMLQYASICFNMPHYVSICRQVLILCKSLNTSRRMQVISEGLKLKRKSMSHCEHTCPCTHTCMVPYIIRCSLSFMRMLAHLSNISRFPFAC